MRTIHNRSHGVTMNEFRELRKQNEELKRLLKAANAYGDQEAEHNKELAAEVDQLRERVKELEESLDDAESRASTASGFEEKACDQVKELQKALAELGKERDQYHEELEQKEKTIQMLAGEANEWVPRPGGSIAWKEWAEAEAKEAE